MHRFDIAASERHAWRCTVIIAAAIAVAETILLWGMCA
jgi:hypothetical protein